MSEPVRTWTHDVGVIRVEGGAVMRVASRSTNGANEDVHLTNEQIVELKRLLVGSQQSTIDVDVDEIVIRVPS